MAQEIEVTRPCFDATATASSSSLASGRQSLTGALSANFNYSNCQIQLTSFRITARRWGVRGRWRTRKLSARREFTHNKHGRGVGRALTGLWPIFSAPVQSPGVARRRDSGSINDE